MKTNQSSYHQELNAVANIIRDQVVPRLQAAARQDPYTVHDALATCCFGALTHVAHRETGAFTSPAALLVIDPTIVAEAFAFQGLPPPSASEATDLIQACWRDRGQLAMQIVLSQRMTGQSKS